MLVPLLGYLGNLDQPMHGCEGAWWSVCVKGKLWFSGGSLLAVRGQLRTVPLTENICCQMGAVYLTGADLHWLQSTLHKFSVGKYYANKHGALNYTLAPRWTLGLSIMYPTSLLASTQELHDHVNDIIVGTCSCFGAVYGTEHKK